MLYGAWVIFHEANTMEYINDIIILYFTRMRENFVEDGAGLVIYNFKDQVTDNVQYENDMLRSPVVSGSI